MSTETNPASSGANPALLRQEDVFILDLGDGENRFNPDRNALIEELLAEAEGTEGAKALVTVASGKYWSNGLDLEWFQANPDRVQEALDQTERLIAAFLKAKLPTVAAIQGHCFAAGAMFALAHDHLIMREDRGFFCLPEADLGLPFTPGMNALILDRLPLRTAHEAMLTARRYGGNEAAAAGIVDRVAAEDEIREAAIARAASQAAKNPDTLGAIKRRMFEETIELLETSHPLGS